jgi:hypothetical protein
LPGTNRASIALLDDPLGHEVFSAHLKRIVGAKIGAYRACQALILFNAQSDT